MERWSSTSRCALVLAPVPKFWFMALFLRTKLAFVKQANGVSDKPLAGNLRLVPMPTDQELAQVRARRAWYLKIARLTDPREPTLSEVAQAAGLASGSGSVISLWENNKAGEGSPKDSQLRRLASYYGLPFSLFSDPPNVETDQERLAGMRRLAIGAVDLEQQDWESGQGPTPDAGDEQDERPGRRSA